MFRLSAAQRGEQLLFASTCADTLPLSKVAGLSRWRHAPLQGWADGHLSASTACRLTIRSAVNSCDAGSKRSVPQQVQLRNAAADVGSCQVKEKADSGQPPCQALVWRY